MRFGGVATLLGLMFRGVGLRLEGAGFRVSCYCFMVIIGLRVQGLGLCLCASLRKASALAAQHAKQAEPSTRAEKGSGLRAQGF